MNTHNRDTRTEFKRAVTGFVSLLGSSVISALGFIIIASNRFIEIDSATAVFVILFVQWQTLGLTIAKTGIEQVVFAVVTENENAHFNAEKYVCSRALPLAFVFSIAVIFVFSPWAALTAFFTIILDTYSLIIMADLNARKRFKTTAISNLLNYPLFFIVIFAVNHFFKLNVSIALAVFLLSSIARWLWLNGNRYVNTNLKEAVCRVNVEMGIQQILNYLLFRADQIVLALVGVKIQTQEGAAMYVFLAKFPELVAGVAVVAGTVLFPRFYIKYPYELKTLFGMLRRHAIYILGYITVIAASLQLYLMLWKGRQIPAYLAAPFLVHAVIIILANNITYSTLRQGYLRRLLMNLSFAVVAGLSLSVFLRFNFSAALLSWVVPIQLFILLSTTFILKWGKPREIYG